MDLIHNLSIGFGVAFTGTNLLYCLIGCILGSSACHDRAIIRKIMNPRRVTSDTFRGDDLLLKF